MENVVDVTKMSATSQEEGHETLILTCEPSLDISLAQALHGTLQRSLVLHQPVVLEAAQVERVDTAILQLLCIFFQEAQGQGMTVSWQQPSLALCTAARLLDLTACLALPVDSPAHHI